MVINFIMNSWHWIVPKNLEYIIINGTAAADALHTSFKYYLANKSSI